MPGILIVTKLDDPVGTEYLIPIAFDVFKGVDYLNEDTPDEGEKQKNFCSRSRIPRKGSNRFTNRQCGDVSLKEALHAIDGEISIAAGNLTP